MYVYSLIQSSNLHELHSISTFIIPPAYEVYRGYIVFVFSVTMLISVCVCVCVLTFFSSKISQELLHLGL